MNDVNRFGYMYVGFVITCYAALGVFLLCLPGCTPETTAAQAAQPLRYAIYWNSGADSVCCRTDTYQAMGDGGIVFISRETTDNVAYDNLTGRIVRVYGALIVDNSGSQPPLPAAKTTASPTGPEGN